MGNNDLVMYFVSTIDIDYTIGIIVKNNGAILDKIFGTDLS